MPATPRQNDAETISPARTHQIQGEYMPPRKKNIITTESWPALKQGRLYEARIKSAVPGKATGFLQVTVENLDSSQLGRIHELKLPLPLRPGIHPRFLTRPSFFPESAAARRPRPRDGH
jgi:hypothetical protein